MNAFDSFWHMDTRSFHAINDALMVLPPKTTEAVTIKDYHPISLIHVLGKLFAKVFANRLTPRLSELIHVSQSAFIKGCYIQDSFKVMQATTKLLHVRKCLALLLKVDITRAFDSMAWLFLLEVMLHVGFPNTWLNWVSVLLSMANTRISLNGAPGDHICHAKGMRQGDPLSPMLFMLVMEVLNGLFCMTDAWKLLHELPSCKIPFRLSMYADGVVTFLSLLSSDLQMTRTILSMFENTSGLRCNVAK
jgi:hypothetical protein